MCVVLLAAGRHSLDRVTWQTASAFVKLFLNRRMYHLLFFPILCSDTAAADGDNRCLRRVFLGLNAASQNGGVDWFK